ncbi:MAG TPA: PAS domain-containing sensor histidine kinase [Candidatus Thermoplasmatota archaeon]|nr:PAS domain-containing sensor histidine kinase [Candidatus Thermoplasmatota archaeon]
MAPAFPDRKAFLAGLWRAHPSVQGAAAQRKARVAAAVLLCLLLVGLVALATIPLLGSDPQGAGLLVGALLGIAVSYLLVRRGHVTAGTLVALVLVEGVVWISRLQSVTHTDAQATLYYLGLPLLVGGLLLPTRAAAGVGLATLASAWLLEALFDQRFGGGVGDEDARLLIFLVGIAALSVAASAIMQREARQAEASTAQMLQLSENIPEVFFIVAPDFSRSYYVSPAYASVWGRPVEGSLADPLDWLKGVHPEDAPALQASLASFAQGTAGMEFRVVQPSGAIRHVRSRTFPVHDAQGAIVSIVGISQDVTEARQAQELLQEANGKLQAAAAERQRMFQQISHDLANPLSPILLHLGILARGRPDQDKSPSLAVIRRNIEQIKRQVEDLRDLARIEGSRLRLALAPVDVAALARETLESFEEVAKEKGVRLDVEAAGPVLAPADKGRIAQVLYNLATNAFKFTPGGGTVRVSCRAQENTVEVTVQDSGRGLTPEEAGRLFQPFSQVHEEGEVKERGTGLGLFICKGIVEAHGGFIGVTSDGRGTGATFTFRLPLRAPVPS